MRILSAIAEALANLTLVIVVWCERVSKFVMRCLPGYQLPDPSDLLNEYMDAAETAPVTPKTDERLRNIALVADALFRSSDIPDAILVGLSDQTISWLEAMDADMLLQVAQARPEDLQAHLAGNGSIRRLLAFDQDSVEAYRRAVAKELEPKIERHGRRSCREPLQSDFRPIC